VTVSGHQVTNRLPHSRFTPNALLRVHENGKKSRCPLAITDATGFFGQQIVSNLKRKVIDLFADRAERRFDESHLSRQQFFLLDV
jgi:hypothetical protein